MQKELTAGLLSRAQADEFAFLRRIRINDTIAVGVIKGDRRIGIAKVRRTLNLKFNAEIATGIRSVEALSPSIERLNGNFGEAGFAVSFALAIQEAGPTLRVFQGLRVIAGCGITSSAVEFYGTVFHENNAG